MHICVSAQAIVAFFARRPRVGIHVVCLLQKTTCVVLFLVAFAMTTSAFGMGPMPFQLPVIDPSSPMNSYYHDQAEARARKNPHDANAQMLWQHWARAMQQIEQARQMQTQKGPQAQAGGTETKPFGIPGAPAATQGGPPGGPADAASTQSFH